MSNPATTSDIEARFRPLTTAEATNAQAYLDDAWALLVGRLPTLEANMTAGTVSTANVVRVVCTMVIRILRNPDGKSEESIDDYRYRRDAATASGSLYVTPEELADLIPVLQRRANSVRLVAYGEL